MRTRGRSRKAQEGAGGGSGASGSVAGGFPPTPSGVWWEACPGPRETFQRKGGRETPSGRSFFKPGDSGGPLWGLGSGGGGALPFD